MYSLVSMFGRASGEHNNDREGEGDSDRDGE